MLSYITTHGLLLFYYALYFLSVFSAAKSNSGKLKDILSGKGDAGSLFSSLIAGIFFLGIGAVVLFEKRKYDEDIFNLDWNGNSVVWVLMAAATVIGILSAIKTTGHNNSIHSLPLHLSLSFIFTRTLFLIAYEFFFRGVLLFIMIEDLGIVSAVIINLVFYTATHWFDKQEKYGSVIMGIVLCTVTIHYNSIWPAIIIHLSLALSYEISLLIKYKSLIKKSWL